MCPHCLHLVNSTAVVEVWNGPNNCFCVIVFAFPVWRVVEIAFVSSVKVPATLSQPQPAGRLCSQLVDALVGRTRSAMTFPNADGCRSPASPRRRASSASLPRGGPRWFVGDGVAFPPQPLAPAHVLPLLAGRPEAPLVPRVVDPGRSHAREVEALRIELQANRMGLAAFGREG